MENTVLHYGFLSIVPALITVILALWSKRVLSALIAGLLVGAWIIDWKTSGMLHALVYSIPNLFSTISGHARSDTLEGFGIIKDQARGELIIGVILIGAFMAILDRSGGAIHFAQAVSKRIRSEKGALLIAMAIGLSIFTSAYFSILVTGTMMIAIFDEMKISREKLSFYCDSMSAPTKALFPFSGWIPFMAVLIEENIPSVGEGMGLIGFVKTMPYNFYCWGMIIFVLLLSVKIIPDFGPMKKAEHRVKKSGLLHEPGSSPMLGDGTEGELNKEVGHGKIVDMFVPLIVSVVILLILSIWDTYMVQWFGVPKVKVNSMQIMNIAFAVALIVAYFMYTMRGVMTSAVFLKTILKGVSSSVTATMIIILAITMGDIMKASAPEGLGTAPFIVQAVTPYILSNWIPALIFLICALMSFAVGSSWGTWAIMMPVAIPLSLHSGIDPFLTAAAVLSGGTFGDHCGPISDTTVLSSIAAKVDHSQHLATQIPYAVVVALGCFVLFAVFGFM